MTTRGALKQELLNRVCDNSLTAEQVREILMLWIEKQKVASDILIHLITRFNRNHHKLLYQHKPSEPALTAQKHRLFNELIYSKASVGEWFKQNTGCCLFSLESEL